MLARRLIPALALALLASLAASGELRAQLPSAVVDSASAELDRGRAWHATRLLLEHPLEAFSPEQLLLLAEAEAGWRHPRGVADALRGQSWIAELEEGRGLYLLGLAEAELGDVPEGVRLLRLYEDLTPHADTRGVTRSRLARAQAAAADFEGALATLERMRQERVELRAWTALAVARSASRAPAPEAVARAVELAPGEPGSRAWALEPEAFVRADEPARAVAEYRERVEALESPASRAWAWMALGELLLEAGDEAAAREAFDTSLRLFPRGTSGARAASGLLELGPRDAAQARAVARLISSGGDVREAVEAWEGYFRMAGEAASAEERLSWARRLRFVDRHEEAVAAFRELEGTGDEDFQLDLLEAWIDTRRDQGRRDAVRTIQGWILERFPESAQAAEIHFYRADDLHDRGAWNEATADYLRAARAGPHSISGLSWMRAAQIVYGQGDFARAAGIYEDYLAAYPDGRRWAEAAYWAARSRAEAGDRAAAEEGWRTIVARYRTSYYTTLASLELEGGYSVDVPDAPAREAPAESLAAGIELLGLFVAAGLDEAAGWWVGGLRERTEGTQQRMALAEALIERGYTVEGIRTGQALLSNGATLDRRLLEILYPFPFREVILAEARERNLDPFLIAGLIRQESAFDADIVSRAGAIGLMQVMPPTGAELARAEGIRGFTSRSLETAEINVHLGVNFLLDLERAFPDDHLPLRLSAYNAGPTRARRWRNLPENADPLRYTERIPFEETRGYVKNVTRNAALYRVLYGSSVAASATESGSN